MKFIVEPQIFKTFPGVSVGIVVIRGMDNNGANGSILALLRSEEASQRGKLTSIELGSLPEISSWREIYTKFGSNKDYRSSIESLLRRARGGLKPLPQINNLVDLYNYLSLKYHMPVGAEDTDKISGNITLRFAKGTETGISLGSEVVETCYPGEVIYRDAAGFICRRWNWREADRTKIDKTTKNAVLVIEKVPAVDDRTFDQAMQEASELISTFLSAKCSMVVLNVTKSEAEL